MKTIGFIGLGSMGLSMALNLRRAGFPVMGYNRTREKEAPLLQAGGLPAGALEELGRRCDVLVLCLPTGDIVREMLLGPGGALTGPVRVRWILDCSTVDVTQAKELGDQLREVGIWYFDAPVSGGPKGAEEGTLTIMVGGDEEQLRQELMPICQAMGRNILHTGPNGTGQQFKLINQILTWVNHAVICEAAALAKRAGLDEDKLYDMLMTSYGSSRVLEVTYKSHIQPRNYENPTGMRMMCKDLTLAQKFARDYHAAMPMKDTAMSLYQKALDSGQGDCDQSIILEQLFPREDDKATK